MNKTEAKRKFLFHKYAKQLSDIVQTRLYKIDLSYEQTFICPICLRHFSVDDLDVAKENHLTLADAPPYSLGGKANTLTCKKCNNESGHKIDFHLVEPLNEQEIRNFSSNIEATVTLEHGGEKVQGILKIDNGGGKGPLKRKFQEPYIWSVKKLIEKPATHGDRLTIYLNLIYLQCALH